MNCHLFLKKRSITFNKVLDNYSWPQVLLLLGTLNIICHSDRLVNFEIQSTPDNLNLQGKLKKGSSYWEFELSRVRRK